MMNRGNNNLPEIQHKTLRTALRKISQKRYAQMHIKRSYTNLSPAYFSSPSSCPFERAFRDKKGRSST